MLNGKIKTKRRVKAPLTIIPELHDLHSKGKPITVSINGKKKFQVEDATALQKLLEFVDWVEPLEGIREGLEDLEAGRSMSLEEFKEEVRRKHGISC